MATIPLFTSEGREIGELELPDGIFGVPFNEALVHQAVVAEAANQRQGTADTRTRSEVRGGGRKPWRQKGTGRARHGSIRSPQWRHGGVVFGPHPRSFRHPLPVNMRRGALRCALSSKVAAGALLGLDALQFVEPPKTRKAVELLSALGLTSVKRVLIITPAYDETLLKSIRNLRSVVLRFAPNFSVRDTVAAHRILLVKDAVARIEGALAPQATRQRASAEVLQ